MRKESSQPRRVRVDRGVYRAPATGAYEITYTASDGRQRWQTVSGGLREARAARAEAVTKLARGERLAPTRQTLAELSDAWLPTQTRLRPRTRTAYETALRVHVLPRLGRRRVSEISEDDVLRLIAEMRAQGKSSWTIRGALTPLSRLLGHAARRGIIASNPMRRLEPGERPPAVSRNEKRILTTNEIAKLLAAARPAYRALLATGVYTGLRISELLGLTWADVDLDRGFVCVRQQLDRQGRRVDPKTEQAVRDVVLLPALGRVLREHKLASRYSGARDFVFASAAGTPLSHRNVARRGLEAAAQAAGLEGDGRPKLTMHALRNTFASHLILDLKLDVVQVSRQLGHARPSITSDLYARLFDKARHSEDIRERMAASEFARALESGAKPE